MIDPAIITYKKKVRADIFETHSQKYADEAREQLIAALHWQLNR